MLLLVLLAPLACQPDPEPVRLPTVDGSPPLVSLLNAAPQAPQGGTLAVFLRTDEAATVHLTALGKERALYPIGDQTWRALIGVPIREDPGPTELAITAIDAWGNRVEHQVSAEIVPVEWPETGKLPMSKRKAQVEPEARKQMREERDGVYHSATPTQLWAGPMRIPVDSAIHTSAFGSFREYPDGSRNHHDAEDLARRRGVPIFASGSGIVALAKAQELHGNAILIDHGQKVVSLYSHLQRIDVEPGQRVEPGDLLGTMGSTGRTTGPHLHWGVVVDEVAVDPMAWTRTGFEVHPEAAFTPIH